MYILSTPYFSKMNYTPPKGTSFSSQPMLVTKVSHALAMLVTKVSHVLAMLIVKVPHALAMCVTNVFNCVLSCLAYLQSG